MKAILVVAFLALASASSSRSATGQTFFDSREEFSRAVRRTLQQIKSQIKNEQPIKLPQVNVHQHNGGLKITVTNAVVRNADKFSVVNIQTLFPRLSVTCQLKQPSASIQGKYQIEGEISGQTVSDNGNFKIDLTDLTETVHINFQEVEQSLQVKSSSHDFRIKEFKVNLQNSDLNGNLKKEVSRVFCRELLEVIKGNRRAINSALEENLTSMVNQELEGKSKQEVLQMSNQEAMDSKEEQ